MKTFLAIIGGLFLLMFFAGAFMPRMNFHAVFGSDEDARDWHLQKAAELDAKIKARANSSTDKVPHD